MEQRYAPHGRARRVAAVSGGFAFFGLAVAVFVMPPRGPAVGAAAAGPAPVGPAPSAATTDPPADTAPAAFPLRSLLPIQTPRPQDLTVAVSQRMQPGDMDDAIYLEIRSSEPLAAVVASTAGTVDEVRQGVGGRATVALRSLDGQVAEYSNLRRVVVQVGQVVAEGEVIGRAGAPEVGDGSLVWYEVRTRRLFFPGLWLESRRPDAEAAWTLEIGPLGELSIRIGGPGSASPGAPGY